MTVATCLAICVEIFVLLWSFRIPFENPQLRILLFINLNAQIYSFLQHIAG